MKSHSTTLLVHDASVVIVALNIHLALFFWEKMHKNYMQ